MLSESSIESVKIEKLARRLGVARKAFAELGFRGNDLEMRTRLFVCYVSNEASMFGLCWSTKDRKIRELRTRLLTQYLTESLSNTREQ
jgi:hypothetical protein